MTISDHEYQERILITLNNNMINFPDGSYRYTDSYNLNDLHATMKSRNCGMDKSKLRDLLEKIHERKLIDKKEGKEQNKRNSKGEYKINAEGRNLIRHKMNLN
jgi:hypothetical protein